MIAAENSTKWYIFYCRSRSEKKVLQMLQDEEYTVCLPLVKELRQWSDRKKKVIVPLIRGYVFVYCDIPQIYKVIQLPNIVTVLKMCGSFAFLHQREIDLLNSIVDNDIPATAQAVSIKKGEKVRVINGPLTGQEGVCFYDSGNKYLVVSIEAIGKELKLKVLSSDVEVVKE